MRGRKLKQFLTKHTTTLWLILVNLLSSCQIYFLKRIAKLAALISKQLNKLNNYC